MPLSLSPPNHWLLVSSYFQVANSKKSSGVEKKANKKKRKGAAGHKIMPRLRTAPDTLFLNDKEQNGDVESNSTTPEETVNQNPFFGRTAAIGGENNSALGDKRNDAAAATAPDGDKNNEVQTAAPPSLFTKSLLAGRRLHLGGTKRASSFGFDSPGTNGRSSLNNAAAAAAAGSKNNELQAGALPSLFTMSLLAGRRLHSGGTERASSVVFDSPGTSGRSRLNNSQSFGRLLTRVDDVSAAFGLSYGADSDEDDDSDEGDDSDEDDDDQWDEERGGACLACVVRVTLVKLQSSDVYDETKIKHESVLYFVASCSFGPLQLSFMGCI